MRPGNGHDEEQRLIKRAWDGCESQCGQPAKGPRDALVGRSDFHRSKRSFKPAHTPRSLVADRHGMGASVLASRLLPVRDVADLLAVSEKTIYRMISAGELPALHVRSQIRVDPDKLAAWLERGEA